MMMTEDRRSKPHFDFVLLILTYALMIMGVLAVAVANYNPEVSADVPLLNRIINSSLSSWQAIFTIASPAAVWFIVAIPYEHFRRYARLYYAIILGMLVFVLAVSTASSGVKAWMRVGLGRMLQPAEFAKITMILMLARVMATNPKPMNNAQDTIRIFGIFLLPAAVTYLQGEMGLVIVMAAVFYIMLFFGGVDWKWLTFLFVIAAIGIATIFAYGLISGSESYRLRRILAFLDPQKYYRDSGHQVLRSLEAIGSGGLTGIGLFVDGSYSQLGYVPEDWTDFVFATVGEAVGFVGSTVIVLLFLFMMLRLLYLARFTYDKFGRMIIIGVMAMLFFHVFQNIAMTLGLMPITGIPLPFISYGGSNLLTNVMGIALVLNVVKNRSNAMIGYVMPVAVTGTSRRKSRKKKIYVNRAGRRTRHTSDE